MKKSVRRICGISYLSIEQILTIVESKQKILRNFAFILHDKDIYTDGDKVGTLKVPHIHFIFLLYYPYPISTIQNWFNGYYDNEDKSINTFVEPCNDVVACYRYLMHLDNPDKFQYNECDIYCGDSSEFLVDDSCEDNSFIALDLMLLGKSRYEIARRLGRDFIYHYGHIKQIYEDILKENEKNV